MAKDKKETKKTIAKAKSIISQSKKLQNDTQAQASKKEDVYPAIQIAKTFGIPDFAFYMIKEAKNLNDGSLLTVSQFQKYYNEVVEGR